MKAVSYKGAPSPVRSSAITLRLTMLRRLTSGSINEPMDTPKF